MYIGMRIKQLREKHNISQPTLAGIIDVSRGNISDWERGRSNPTIKPLRSLARFFNVSTDWLITGEEKENFIGTGKDWYKLTEQEQTLIKAFRKCSLPNRRVILLLVRSFLKAQRGA